MTENDNNVLDDLLKEYSDRMQNVTDSEHRFEVHIPDEGEPEPDVPTAAEAEEEPLQYRRAANNRGGGFTLRTNDDADPKKIKSRQQEYQRRGEDEIIGGQIARLNDQLTVRAAVLLFAAVFSLFITISNDLGLTLTPIFDRTVNPSAYIFTNTLLGIISVGFSYSVVSMGLKSLFRGSPDTDTLASVNILAAIISGIVTLFEPEAMKLSYFHIYTAAAITLLLFNTLGKLSVVRRTMRNFEFVSKAESFYALQHTEDEQEQTAGKKRAVKELSYLKRTDFVRDFMKNSYSSDLADLFAEKTSLVILLTAIAVGAMSFVFDHTAAETQERVFIMLAAVSGTLSICSSFSLALTANRPLAVASRKALDNSGVLLGYSSVEEYADVSAMLIDLPQLLPDGCAEIERMKLIGQVSAEQAAAYAAALAQAGGSITAPELLKLMQGDTDRLPEVTSCTAADGGISGLVDFRRMLFGSRALMERRDIEGLPSEEEEKRFANGGGVMYLAVSGSAVMMLSVRLTAQKAAVRWIRELERDRVRLYVRSCDGFVTQELIAQLYGMRPASIRLMPPEGNETSDSEPDASVSASMICTGHLTSFAMLLVAARRVKYSANIGIAVQYGSMLLGMAVSVILMLLGAFSQITPTIVILYNLAFWLVTELLQSGKQV